MSAAKPNKQQECQQLSRISSRNVSSYAELPAGMSAATPNKQQECQQLRRITSRNVSSYAE
jgi:hypothetical protein